MHSRLITYAAPIVLLLTLVFLAGVVSAATESSETPTANFCCGGEDEHQEPAPQEGECADPGCRCPSCGMSLLQLIPIQLTSYSGPTPLQGGLAAMIPSDHILSIDYPPEVI